MRLTSAFAAILLLTGLVPAKQDDRSAVEAVIETWNEGWRTKNAELAAQGYSADADWINAFAMRERGRDAIAKKLREVFALPFVMGAQSRMVAQDIRFMGSQVAVVITQVEREGQKTPSGEARQGRRPVAHREPLDFRCTGSTRCSTLTPTSRRTTACRRRRAPSLLVTTTRDVLAHAAPDAGRSTDKGRCRPMESV
jgi:uncharacterized protein (TIGR02246 family)